MRRQGRAQLRSGVRGDERRLERGAAIRLRAASVGRSIDRAQRGPHRWVRAARHPRRGDPGGVLCSARWARRTRGSLRGHAIERSLDHRRCGHRKGWLARSQERHESLRPRRRRAFRFIVVDIMKMCRIQLESLRGKRRLRRHEIVLVGRALDVGGGHRFTRPRGNPVVRGESHQIWRCRGRTVSCGCRFLGGGCAGERRETKKRRVDRRGRKRSVHVRRTALGLSVEREGCAVFDVGEVGERAPDLPSLVANEGIERNAAGFDATREKLKLDGPDRVRAVGDVPPIDSFHCERTRPHFDAHARVVPPKKLQNHPTAATMSPGTPGTFRPRERRTLVWAEHMSSGTGLLWKPSREAMVARMSRETSSGGRAEKGVVYLVGAGPGDPGLVTERAMELVASADVILHDELVHPALVARARSDARIEHVGKRGSAPTSARQSDIDAALVAHAAAGSSVVRLKGGDPYLFGRGSEEAEALALAGVPFEVVPGVTSPLAAAAYAGISLTHRALASSVVFVSAVQRDKSLFDFAELRGIKGTICVLMGLHRIEEVCSALMHDAGRSKDTRAVVISEGTLPSQKVIEGTLAEIGARTVAEGLSTPAMLIVGEVARLRDQLRWFDRRPLFGRRVLVTRPVEESEGARRAFHARGASVVSIPLIEIVDLPSMADVDEAIARLDRYDFVVFTSENGVSRFMTRLFAVGRDARAFGRAKIAAVGPSTAEALSAFGLRADIVPTRYTGDALAEVLATGGSVGARVLIPRALVARDVVPKTLREHGMIVEVLPVYETRLSPRSRRDELIAALEHDVDVVTLMSSSAATSLFELLGERVDLLTRVTIVSIGPITTRTAEEAGVRVDVTAEASTLEGMIASLEAHVARVSVPSE